MSPFRVPLGVRRRQIGANRIERERAEPGRGAGTSQERRAEAGRSVGADGGELSAGQADLEGVSEPWGRRLTARQLWARIEPGLRAGGSRAGYEARTGGGRG